MNLHRLAAYFLLAATAAGVVLGITGELDNHAHVRDGFGVALVAVLIGCLLASCILAVLDRLQTARRGA